MEPVNSRDFILAIQAAMGMPKAPIQRIIIDAEMHDCVKVYVQFVGEQGLLDLDLKSMLRGAAKEKWPERQAREARLETTMPEAEVADEPIPLVADRS